ncbi:hypothetical protein GCM10025857_07020 [Alicyclobacillus contaminans]|nr:hypothetical protein GCM10025857_07020 [Alicyclobacillus contaminans]
MAKHLSLFGDEFEQPQPNPDRNKDHRENTHKATAAAPEPGVCPQFGGGSFLLRVENHQWIRTCNRCAAIRIMD